FVGARAISVHRECVVQKRQRRTECGLTSVNGLTSAPVGAIRAVLLSSTGPAPLSSRSIPLRPAVHAFLSPGLVPSSTSPGKRPGAKPKQAAQTPALGASA